MISKRLYCAVYVVSQRVEHSQPVVTDVLCSRKQREASLITLLTALSCLSERGEAITANMHTCAPMHAKAYIHMTVICTVTHYRQ